MDQIIICSAVSVPTIFHIIDIWIIPQFGIKCNMGIAFIIHRQPFYIIHCQPDCKIQKIATRITAVLLIINIRSGLGT